MIIFRNITPTPSVLIQREFARADYAGLDDSAQSDLRFKKTARS